MQIKKQELEPDMEQQTGSKLEKEYVKAYAEYIMQNTRLYVTQAGIKIARRNINNLRYTDDTTLMAKVKKKLKSILIKVKEESEKLA